MNRPIKVGSLHTVRGTVYEVDAFGRKAAKDLTGADVVLKIRQGSGAWEPYTCTVDANQVANRGVFSYVLQAGDIDTPGPLEIEAVVEGIRSDSVHRTAEA